MTEGRTFSKIAMGGKPAIRWAVIVVIALAVGAWWAFRSASPPVVQIAGENDVAAPFRCYATLTLAGGQPSGELLYNTLNNPRGSKVMDVTLSDGTRVWLNAGSSIRWPAVFPSEDRTVEVTGEAYFEVASDARRPFRVKKGNMTVDVLGTSFNIRAYNDDPLLRVTLFEGKVRVTADNSLTLERGEQAVVEDRVEVIKDVHLDGIVAWKKGLFSFSHTNLVTAMRELGCWYNVEVIYGKDMPDRYFTGVFDRTLTLDHVLKALADDRLHYSIDAGKRRLMIMP